MSVRSARENIQGSRPHTQHDVVVVGAGPYGLSAAAHLQGKGLNVAIFGKPLESWREKMPKDMFLRSHWWATNLSDPQKKYGLKHFFQVSEYSICYPMPIQAFIDYGMWFQKHAVPSVDPTYVSLIERHGGQFVLTLEDGRVVQSAAVVIAVGPHYFKHIPAEFAHLPTALLTHSCDHGDFSRFAARKVAIIGGGQSAVEYAALLNEAGASVDLIARRPITWAENHGEARRPLIERLRAPDSGIAPGWKYKGLEVFPYLFQRLPSVRKDCIVRNNHFPVASIWLRDRVLGKVALHEGHTVTKVLENAGGVELAISDNTRLNVDHIILATGYETKISHLPLLGPSILPDIKTYLGSPILNPWFESSVPGCYFLGFASLQSFGPLYRFVAGVPATAPRVASAVARRVEKAR